MRDGVRIVINIWIIQPIVNKVEIIPVINDIYGKKIEIRDDKGEEVEFNVGLSIDNVNWKVENGKLLS